MRYSIEPRYRIYVKVCGSLSFAKDMGKSLSNKYGQELLDSAKNYIKKSFQKTAEATGYLIGNKIADKITSVSKKSTTKLFNDQTEADRYSSKDAGEASLKDVPKKKIYISRRKTTNC